MPDNSPAPSRPSQNIADLRQKAKSLQARTDYASKRDAALIHSMLADALLDRGQPKDATEALLHYRVSLEIQEALLLAFPDSAELRRDISVSHSKLGELLANRSQPGEADEALRHYHAALDLRERLLQLNPKSAQASRDVSLILERLGDFLSRRSSPGDPEEVLSYYTRENEISEQLLLANPASPQAARDVSASLIRLADFLASRGLPGDAEKAMGHYLRCHEVLEHLMLANPGSAQAARDVSVILERLGDFMSLRGLPGDSENTMVHYQRSLEVRQRLYSANPDSAQAARDLLVSLSKLADFLARRGLPGDAEKAMGHYQHGLAVSEQLLLANPESTQAARDVSVNLSRLADYLVSRGLPNDAEKALGLYQRCHEVLERLHMADPTSAQAARDVSVCLNKLADFLANRGLPGDAEKALGYYQSSLDVSERLHSANPESAQAARDVSVSLERLGNFMASRGLPGDAEKALKYYQRCLEASERLYSANPESAQVERDVSVGLHKLADFLSRRGLPGDAEEALGHYQRSLEISERLQLANPKSAQAARDVSVSLCKLADFLALRGLPGDAENVLGYYQRSLEVSEQLLLANPESAQAARDVMVQLERMAGIEGRRAGGEAKALEMQARALSIALRLREGNPQSVFYGRTSAVSFFLTYQRAQAAGEEELAKKCLAGCYRVLDELISAGCQLDPHLMDLHAKLKPLFSKP